LSVRKDAHSLQDEQRGHVWRAELLQDFECVTNAGKPGQQKIGSCRKQSNE
jgi:hypothetical protein